MHSTENQARTIEQGRGASERGGRPERDPSPARRWAKVGGALFLAATGMFGATRFEREAPAAETPTPGMTVSKDSVSLDAQAPMWKSLKIGEAKALETFRTDPVPARVRIDETRAAKVASPLQGRVTDVFVELGETVKPGTKLFSVTSPEIAQLHAEKEKADVELETAAANLERVKALVEARALPAKEEMLVAHEYRQAEVNAKAWSTRLRALSVSGEIEGAFTVSAPRAGVVVAKNILSGQEVGPETAEAAVVIADLSEVWVLADLFEADATNVVEGSKAEITSPSLPNQVVEGIVEKVSAVVDAERHTVPIRIRVDNAKRLLRPNVYADVRIVSQAPQGAVVVPATALVTDGSQQFVFVEAEGGKLTRRSVVAGSTHEGLLPVLSGLQAGERVVEEGGILLDNQIALAQ